MQIQARETVNRLLHNMDAPPVRDAVGALQAFAGRLLNAELVVGERVNRLSSLGDVDEKGAQQIRAEVAVLLELLKLIRATLADMGRLNIEERAQRLDEAKAAVVVAVLLEAARELGWQVDDGRVRSVVAGALERVGAA